jgi:hypothetical protein
MAKSLRERLRRLEPVEPTPPRSPEHAYAMIRSWAAEDIAESLAAGEEPLYRIADNGDVETADGRPINHLGDYMRALDECIGQLEAEIAAEEENH